MNRLLEAILARQSIREFRSEPPPLELVLRVLEAAIRAPNAHNAQPWHFIIILREEVKARLVEAMADAWRRDLRELDGLEEAKIERIVRLESYERIGRAPCLILACLDMGRMDRYEDERRQRAEYIMGVQSVAAAIENLLLAAHALGLGACWLCAPLFCQEAVRRVLGIPEGIEPQALIILGYPAERPPRRPRRPLSEVLHLEGW